MAKMSTDKPQEAEEEVEAEVEVEEEEVAVEEAEEEEDSEVPKTEKVMSMRNQTEDKNTGKIDPMDRRDGTEEEEEEEPMTRTTLEDGKEKITREKKEPERVTGEMKSKKEKRLRTSLPSKSRKSKNSKKNKLDKSMKNKPQSRKISTT